MTQNDIERTMCTESESSMKTTKRGIVSMDNLKISHSKPSKQKSKKKLEQFTVLESLLTLPSSFPLSHCTDA